jgi:nitroreductase
VGENLDIIDIIKGRRSVREYSDKNISDKHVEKILEAARWSPSAVNMQPWKFVVVRDGKIKKKIGDASRYYFVGNRHVSAAPMIIVVCANTNDNKWAVMDCSMASQSMMLEAYSLGISSCFVGAFDENKIKGILDIPEKMNIVGIVVFGYSKGSIKDPGRISMDKIVSYDKYEDKGTSNPLKSGALSVITKGLKRKSG